SSLPNLKSLRAFGTPLKDLEPLRFVKHLGVLHISRCSVDSIEPLAGNENLVNLWLDNCPVEDLRPIRSMPNLSNLSISDTNVSDFSPIAFASKMTSLQIVSSGHVVDLSFVQSLQLLERLVVTRSKIVMPPSFGEARSISTLSFYETNLDNLAAISELNKLKV